MVLSTLRKVLYLQDFWVSVHHAIHFQFPLIDGQVYMVWYPNPFQTMSRHHGRKQQSLFLLNLGLYEFLIDGRSFQYLVSAGKKQLFWFFLRWLLCRQKPNVLFVRSAFQHGIQRFGAWRSGGFRSSKLSIHHKN